MESVFWVPVHFVIFSTTRPIRGATGWSKEAIGASRYFLFEMLFALPIVNRQKTLKSQRSETHGNKVNPQTLSTNSKRKKEPKTFMVIFWGVIYLLLNGRLSTVF